jgi:hypothetical protein
MPISFGTEPSSSKNLVDGKRQLPIIVERLLWTLIINAAREISKALAQSHKRVFTWRRSRTTALPFFILVPDVRKERGLAAPYAVPVSEKLCGLRQAQLLDARDELQGIAAFFAMAEAKIQILARRDHKAALAFVFADWTRASQLTGTPSQIEVENFRNIFDADNSAEPLEADAFWHRAPPCERTVPSIVTSVSAVVG